MKKNLSPGALAVLLTAAQRPRGTKSEIQELKEAGLLDQDGKLNEIAKGVRRSAFEKMEDEAFG